MRHYPLVRIDGGGYEVHLRGCRSGIWNLELMTFAAMENEKVSKFMFVFTPLRLKGATGSPGRPIAVL